MPRASREPAILFFFVTQHPAGGHVTFHTHTALELVYYAEGAGSTVVDGVSHPYRRGRFALVPADVAHDEKQTAASRAICLGVVNSGLERFAGCWFDADGRLRDALERLQAEMAAPERPGRDAVLRGLLWEIIGLAERARFADDAAPPGEQTVRRAVDLIRRAEGRVTVERLSAELFVSKDYLRHLFQEYAEQPPIRLILNARIEKAKNLLARRDLSLGEIARDCGFETPFYFSRLFRRETGTTPSAYRKSLL